LGTTLCKGTPNDALLYSLGYKNTNTAWWDSSQIYGSSEAVTRTLRTRHKDGKLHLTKDGRVDFLPRDKASRTAFRPITDKEDVVLRCELKLIDCPCAYRTAIRSQASITIGPYYLYWSIYDLAAY
jgi:hypothetical protein